jgi:RHS repeat-associated protein
VKKYENGITDLPYRFTSKELDGETGLYYYGARYLDPRTSRWLSGDPALGEYLPGAPVNDEARKNNQNLPGGGGIFNLVNLHVYHYAGNNPVKYVDPDGRELDLSELDETQHAKFEEAYNKLLETDRGMVIIAKLVFSENKYTVKMNNIFDDGYAPNTRTINWDPELGAMSGDDKVLTPTLLLGHELGHAFMHETQRGSSEQLGIFNENLNIQLNENPIARQLGLGVRSDYHDWQYTFSSDGVNSTSIPPYDKTISINLVFLERLGGRP